MSSSPQSPYLPSISEDAVHPAARDLGLFLPEGSAVLDNARQLNHIAAWSFLFLGVNFVFSGVVRATGAVAPPLLILVLCIPFASLMQAVLGVDAIWWSFPIS